MRRDPNVIPTLGPFAFLLWKTLEKPPVENVEVQEKNTTHRTIGWPRITLYRGLGLPKAAIKVYQKKLESQGIFEFTSFTSTSCEKDCAIPFAYQYGHLRRDQGQVPVLLVMDVEHYNGDNKAFLHDTRSSAFDSEKEYLLGNTQWKVKKMEEETLSYVDEEEGTIKFPGFVIDLK